VKVKGSSSYGTFVVSGMEFPVTHPHVTQAFGLKIAPPTTCVIFTTVRFWVRTPDGTKRKLSWTRCKA